MRLSRLEKSKVICLYSSPRKTHFHFPLSTHRSEHLGTCNISKIKGFRSPNQGSNIKPLPTQKRVLSVHRSSHLLADRYKTTSHYPILYPFVTREFRACNPVLRFSKYSRLAFGISFMNITFHQPIPPKLISFVSRFYFNCTFIGPDMIILLIWANVFNSVSYPTNRPYFPHFYKHQILLPGSV